MGSRWYIDITSRFFFQAEDGIRDYKVTGVRTCALPISPRLRYALHVGPFEPAHMLLFTSPSGKRVATLSITNSRSEEHTSELQSPCNIVCRLLLAKKKTQLTNPPPPDLSTP